MEYPNKFPNNTNQSVARSETPGFVIFIAALALLVGIQNLLLLLTSLATRPLAGLIYLVIGVSMIASAVGLWRMHKWALYLFTVVIVVTTAVLIIPIFYSSTKHTIDPGLVEYIFSLVLIAVLIYLWSITNKFVTKDNYYTPQDKISSGKKVAIVVILIIFSILYIGMMNFHLL